LNVLSVFQQRSFPFDEQSDIKYCQFRTRSS
jgi:hypothetical protein